jgi:hypothetical protein
MIAEDVITDFIGAGCNGWIEKNVRNAGIDHEDFLAGYTQKFNDIFFRASGRRNESIEASRTQLPTIFPRHFF